MGWRAWVASGCLLALFAVRCGGQSVKTSGSGGEGNESTGAVGGVGAGPPTSGATGGTGGSTPGTGGSGPTPVGGRGPMPVAGAGGSGGSGGSDFGGMSGIAGEGGVGGNECGLTFDAPNTEYVVVNLDQLEMLRGVTVFRGDLIIREAHNLEPLGCLQRIEGSFRLESDLVGTLAGLGSITEVTGVLALDGTNIVDLPNFVYLGTVGSLYIDGNPLLPSLWGLENFGNVRGRVIIAHNPSLENIEALESINSIGGDLVVENNVSLPSCAVEELVEAIGVSNIGGEVIVIGNDDLATCEGTLTCDRGEIVGDWGGLYGQEALEAFAGYTQITGEFFISNARDLSPLACLTRFNGINTEIWYLDAPDATGLDALTEVTGSFGFGGPLESLHGLESLQRVGMDLWFSGPQFPDLSGLESLVEVGGVLSLHVQTLENVEALSNVERLGAFTLARTLVQTLAGLENVVEIGGDPNVTSGHLIIQENVELRDLRALANLTHVSGDLRVEDNPALPTCEAEWLVASVRAKGGIDGVVYITGNGSGTCD